VSCRQHCENRCVSSIYTWRRIVLNYICKLVADVYQELYFYSFWLIVFQFVQGFLCNIPSLEMMLKYSNVTLIKFNKVQKL
jgi:hypothetical protein